MGLSVEFTVHNVSVGSQSVVAKVAGEEMRVDAACVEVELTVAVPGGGVKSLTIPFIGEDAKAAVKIFKQDEVLTWDL